MVMKGNGCSCEWLCERLQSVTPTADDINDNQLLKSSDDDTEKLCTSSVLLLDCRTPDEYNNSHVQGSIPVSVPPLIHRRLQNGSGSVMSVISKDKWSMFENLCKSGAVVILYDQSGSSVVINEVNSSPTTNNNNTTQILNTSQPTSPTTSSSVLPLLMKRLESDGCQVRYLEGGFKEFHLKFPHLCNSADQPKSDSITPGLDGGRPSKRGIPPALSLPGTSDPCLIGCTSVLPGLSRLNLSDSIISHSGSLDSKERCGKTPNSAYPFPVEVLPRLYLGNADTAANLECLKSHNIGYVLNVTTDIPNKFESGNERMTYMRIPIMDHLSQDLQSYFSQAIEFIDEGRGRGQGVLVHCLAGISRSVTVTVAYLMKNQSLSLDDAFDLLRKFKPNISPNFNFMGQLESFEKTLKSTDQSELTRDDVTHHLTNDVTLSDDVTHHVTGDVTLAVADDVTNNVTDDVTNNVTDDVMHHVTDDVINNVKDYINNEENDKDGPTSSTTSTDDTGNTESAETNV